jgi:hypothetical protein
MPTDDMPTRLKHKSLTVKHYVLMGSQPSMQDAQNNTMPNYNVFCNICTVNYLLAGIYNYAMHFIEANKNANSSQHAWYQLMRCLSLDEHLVAIRTRVIRHTPTQHLRLTWHKLIKVKSY